MHGLSLCPFSGLVCDLLRRRLPVKGSSPWAESALREGHPESQFEWALLVGHRSRGASGLPTPSWEGPIASGVTFLQVGN